jgi:hypothetical protein
MPSWRQAEFYQIQGHVELACMLLIHIMKSSNTNPFGTNQEQLIRDLQQVSRSTHP